MPMDSLAGKAALITGGAARIGAEIARHLHAAGMDLAIHYCRSAQAAEALKAELEAERPDSVLLVQADLLNTRALPRMIEAVEAEFGGLHALVNNASSFYPTPLDAFGEEEWDDLMGSNLKAPLFLSQAAAPLLRASGGAIVNLVDVHARRPLREHTLYCVAKAGNAMLVQSLARELGPEVRVNGVAPGAILWPEHDLDEEAKRTILERTALKRPGEPADIARAVLFLLRDAPYVTGQIIAVDGGRSIQQ